MESCENKSVDEVQGMQLVNCDRTKCQRYSRIVGYYRPLSQWNEGKQAEWTERKVFNKTAQ